jgi:hypothetical protein
MGTTLTGTTPATTYDSLIKVTDNGPISGTAKYLSDGLGNDSVLALSTTAVGIGTSSPTEKLDVIGGALAAGNGTIRTGITYSSLGLLGTFTNHDLGLITNGTEKARITSAGNVGIGTSSPAGKLHISGDGAAANLIRLQNTGAGTNGFFDISVTSTEAQVIANYSTTPIPMLFLTGAAERMRITSAGNVGIGTSSPNTKLDVNGTINVRNNGYEFGRITTNNVSGVDGGLTFQYITGGVFTNGLLLDAAGNVGIGTGSPAYRFNVVTDAIAGAQNLAAIDRTAQNFVTFTNPQFSTDASMGLMLRVFPQSDARQGAGILASGGALNGETDLNLFVSSGSVSSTSYSALTLKGGTGNVGIGTTAPSNFEGVTFGDSILDVNGVIQVRGDATNNNALVQFGGSTYRKALMFSSVGTDVGYLGVAIAANGTDSSSTEVARFTPNGLTFNGDTAANNALSDYEQGTFTATITPATSGTITSGGTFTTWTYTKIGRQVTISGVFVISSVASPVGATVIIGGLPFTIFNNNGAYGAFSAAYFTSATSADSAVSGRHSVNTTQLTLGVDASTVAASDEIYVKATYFV